MANYAASVLAKGQGVVTARNQSPEQRRKIPSVMGLALQNQQYSIPNANDLRLSPLRPVEIYYQKNIAPGVGTTKAYNHTGTYGDTGSVTLTYISHVEPFSLPRKIAYNNILTYENMFNNLYEMAWKNLRTRHDDSALAFVLTNRVQLSSAVMTPQLASANPGFWNETQYALEISQADRLLFAQRVKSAMASRFLNGDIDIIADLQMTAAFQYAAAQGAGNGINTSYQFLNDFNVSVTQSVVDSDYSLGSVLALPKGLFSGLIWNEGLNKKGVSEDIGGPVGTLGTAADPFGSGAIADISMYTNRADTSANATGGSTQDIVDQWELTLTIGYALPPLTTSGDSVVMEVAQSA